MPRISATVKPSIKKVLEQYAIFYEVSFSASVEIHSGKSALEWWGKLSNKQKKELNQKWEEK